MIPLAEGEYYAVIESSASGTSATTGYTTYASIGHYSLTGTLRPSTLVSKPPVASTAGTSPLKGSAPLIVGFNGTQSSDPDGIVVEYLWTFDDGTTAITANPTRTFTTPGIHPVTLLVTDNQGLTGTTNLNIEVVNSRIIFVSAIVPGFSGTGASASADILVTVKDDKGALVANAMVYGRLSGIGQGDVIGRTNSKGQVRLRGRIPPLTRGALTFTVTNLTLAGGIYDASFNVETTDSVSR
jgi:PKD repeat protein